MKIEETRSAFQLLVELPGWQEMAKRAKLCHGKMFLAVATPLATPQDAQSPERLLSLCRDFASQYMRVKGPKVFDRFSEFQRFAALDSASVPPCGGTKVAIVVDVFEGLVLDVVYLSGHSLMTEKMSVMIGDAFACESAKIAKVLGRHHASQALLRAMLGKDKEVSPVPDEVLRRYVDFEYGGRESVAVMNWIMADKTARPRLEKLCAQELRLAQAEPSVLTAD